MRRNSAARDRCGQVRTIRVANSDGETAQVSASLAVRTKSCVAHNLVTSSLTDMQRNHKIHPHQNPTSVEKSSYVKVSADKGNGKLAFLGTDEVLSAIPAQVRPNVNAVAQSA